MYVSIMKTDPTLRYAAQGISCLLYIPESEIDDSVVVDSSTPLLFDATDKYYYVYEYAKRLKEASKEFNVPLAVLHAFIKDGDKLLNQKVLDEQFGGTLQFDKIHLHGYYYGKPVHIFLNDPRFKEVAESLRTNFYNKCKTVEIRGINSHGESVSMPYDMKSFIENHNYEICNKLLRQSENYLIDTKMNTGICMEIPTKGYEIQINTRNPKYMVNHDIIIRNVRDGRYAYIGGLTQYNVTLMIQDFKYIDSHPEYKSTLTPLKLNYRGPHIKHGSSFNGYIRRSLDLIGLDTLGIDSFYKDIVTNINMYKDVNFNDKDVFDFGVQPYDKMVLKDKRCPGSKIGKLPLSKIQGVVDEDYAGKEETELPDISMNNLKWFLLYLADNVIVPNVKISHALPIYVYKNNAGKLSAIFNYMEKETELGVHELWDTLRLKFKPVDIDDILSYYDRTTLIAYKTYVRTRPNVRVIVDDDIIIN